MLSSLGTGDICCVHFEDAPLGSIINRAAASFAFGGMESASLTGGGENACKLGCLINKIYYDNDVTEMEDPTEDKLLLSVSIPVERGSQMFANTCTHTEARKKIRP